MDERAKTKTQSHVAGATTNKARIRQAEARKEQAESRTEQAKTRTEMAETRTERAETRTELAKTRTEQAEIRAEQAETRAEQAEAALKRVIHKEAALRQMNYARTPQLIPVNVIPDQKCPFEELTSRQRDILQRIVEGQNTKQIAGILKVSPKTVEYHRTKLMAGLNVRDVPGLIRFAYRVGLIPQGN